jgi:hypothetical protein
LCWRSGLAFATDEAPDFICLHSANLEVPNVHIVVFGAGFAYISKQLCDRVFGRSRHSASRPNAATFNEAADDLRTALGV